MQYCFFWKEDCKKDSIYKHLLSNMIRSRQAYKADKEKAQREMEENIVTWDAQIKAATGKRRQRKW